MTNRGVLVALCVLLLSCNGSSPQEPRAPQPDRMAASSASVETPAPSEDTGSETTSSEENAIDANLLGSPRERRKLKPEEELPVVEKASLPSEMNSLRIHCVEEQPQGGKRRAKCTVEQTLIVSPRSAESIDARIKDFETFLKDKKNFLALCKDFAKETKASEPFAEAYLATVHDACKRGDKEGLLVASARYQKEVEGQRCHVSNGLDETRTFVQVNADTWVHHQDPFPPCNHSLVLTLSRTPGSYYWSYKQARSSAPEPGPAGQSCAKDSILEWSMKNYRIRPLPCKYIEI